MQTKRKLTRYSSIDKPWLKYYQEEAINNSLSQYSICSCLFKNNKDYFEDVT